MTQHESSGTLLPRPTPIQAAWQDMEMGLFVHFNMFTYSGDWNWRSFRDYPAPALFRPDRLDTDQWMEAAAAIGARYAVLTAKHCCGFCLWPTEAYDYGVRQSAWRGGQGDVVGDFVTSCRKHGIRPGLYYSTSANGFLKVDNPGLIAAPGGPVDQAGYTRICEKQLRELWSRYGELGEIWFDGSSVAVEKGGPDVGALLSELQPTASVFQSRRPRSGGSATKTAWPPTPAGRP
ncbi:MAG: alpha-L-fucosidase [Planctomycetota bacterium]